MEGSNTTLSIRMSFGIEEDAHLLMQSSKPVRTISSSVESLTIDMIGETVIPSPHKVVHVPNYPHEYVTWKGPDKALRYYADNKLVDIVDQAICSCAVFADSSTMATAAEDGTVRIWRILRTGQQVSLTCRFLMRGHATRVNCISSCKAWSMVVTGGDDGSVCFWDLNKGRFLKSIQLGEGRSDPIIAVSIMESTVSLTHFSPEDDN
jgi:WD40 repeat protein